MSPVCLGTWSYIALQLCVIVRMSVHVRAVLLDITNRKISYMGSADHPSY